MIVELTTEQLEGIAYFASAEAASQGYDLTNEGEARSFLNHVEGSARQYFMKQGVWPFFQLRAGPEIGETFLVRAMICHQGNEAELACWDIPSP